MTEKPQKSRKLRADAQRNRDHILGVARQAFAENGDSVTLEDIVKRSGLGVGTLYRHFKTRDELVQAVYFTEVQKLSDAADDFSATLPPVDALRAWLLLFIELLATKHAMHGSLNAVAENCPQTYSTTTEIMKAAIEKLLDRASAAGDIQLGANALDILWAVGGVAHASRGPEGESGARRLVEILISGLQTNKP